MDKSKTVKHWWTSTYLPKLQNTLSPKSPHFPESPRLRNTNVLSTIRLVEFCATAQLKPLHFASTLGIFPAYFALVGLREQPELYFTETNLYPKTLISYHKPYNPKTPKSLISPFIFSGKINTPEKSWKRPIDPLQKIWGAFSHPLRWGKIKNQKTKNFDLLKP